MTNFALIGFLCIIAMEYLGLGYQFSILQKLYITSILPFLMFAYVMVKHGLSDAFANSQVKVLTLLVIMTAAAMLYGLIGHNAIAPFKAQLGYLVILIVGFYALRGTTAIQVYLWTMVGIHAFAVIKNFDRFDQSMRAGAFSHVGYFMGDGNDFGWSLVITFAFSLFLVTYNKRLLVRVIAVAMALIILVGIVGTKSRGATLALSAAMLYYLLFISKRKFLGFLLVLIVALGVWLTAPPGYFERMETLSTYEEDTSATNRIRAWGHAFEMAVDHPFLGVGAGSFNSAYGRFYRVEGDPARWISTHSTYFKVLAEYGFTGIILFLSLLYLNFMENQRTARLLRTTVTWRKIPDDLPLFLNMGLIGYVVAGTFLGGVEYPHIFLITSATLAMKWLAREQPPAEAGPDAILEQQQR